MLNRLSQLGECGYSMSKSATSVRDLPVAQEPLSPTPEEIKQQLRAVLASPAFHGTKRCQQFLDYVCERSLAGEASALKERSIAIEVFGRQPQSDLGEDTIVRVGAREVRKRLAQYYVSPEGAASKVRIDLRSGSYAPEFRYAAALHEEEPATAITAIEDVPRRDNGRLFWGLGSVALISLTVLAVVELASANPNARAFRQFWDPVLRSSDPLLLAVAHPIVYHASGRAIRMSEENLPKQDVPLQRQIQVPANKLNGSDIVPVFNQYVGFGDMVAATEVSSMLGRSSKGVRIRMASNVEFADLRKAPTMLIGAVTNRWTMELQQAWRFRFSWTPGTRIVIVDTQDRTGGTEWSISAKDDGSAPEDYMLLCRIRSDYTGGLLLVAAGLKQFGTEAAGRLLADADSLGVILRKLPEGWEAKNVQLVLHARVIGNTPAQPEVVASHVW
jgi:hypothetical protein